MPEPRRLWDPSLGRFLLVGLSNTALSYGVFRVGLWLLPALSWRAAAAQLTSYAAGIGWSFLWNRAWTFRSQGPAGREMGRFVVLQLALLGLSTALVGLLVDYYHLWATASWVVVMGFVTLLNYAGSRYWVFRSALPPRTGDAS